MMFNTTARSKSIGVVIVLAGLASAAIVASASAQSAGADAASGTRLSLVEGATSEFKINFGTGRSPQHSVVTLVSQPPASQVAPYVLGDLTRADGATALPADQVRATTDVSRPLAGSNEASVVITVTVDPANTEPGTYTGSVRVVSDDSPPVTLPLTVTLQGGPGWWVALLLFAGALLGTFAVWLTQAGSVINDANRRYMRIWMQVQPVVDHIPQRFQQELLDARNSIQQLDATAASKAVDQLEAELPNVLEETTRLRQIQLEITNQETLSQRPPAPPSGNAAILGASTELQRLIADAVPSQTVWVTNLDTSLQQFKALTMAFVQYQGANQQTQDALNNALGSFAEGDFAAGKSAVYAALGRAVPNVIPFAPPVQPHATRWESIQQFLSMLVIRGQPFLSAVIVGVVTMLTGLELLYFSNPTFGASKVDYLIAFGWGLGLQIAGTSITQMGTALVGKGPKLS